MRKAWSWVTLLVAAPALSGCGLPPLVTIASYSADIVSYEATGKTVTDHAYSWVARSDCSFMRVLRDKPICVDPPVKAAKPVQRAAAPVAPAASATTMVAERAPSPPSSAPKRAIYVTIGSFLATPNAERAQARYAAYHPAIVAAIVHGRRFHRVVAGPLTRDEAAMLRQELFAATPGAKPARG
jgi:SPOR domain